MRVTLERIIIIVGAALIIGGLMLAPVADAQTVPGQVNLSWTLPTEGCNFSVSPPACAPLTGNAALTAINVFISTSPIPDDSPMPPTLALAGDAVAAVHTLQVPSGATLYARVKALNAYGASRFSAQVSKRIDVPLLPGPPTNVTIELQIDVAAN